MKFFDFFKRKKEVREYEGSARGRRTSSWKAGSGSADAEIFRSLVTLRNRARDLVRNNAYAARGLEVLTNEIVGHGIVPFLKHPNKVTQDRLNKELKAWAESKSVDFGGRMDLYGMQRLVTRSFLESGEVLVQEKKLTSNYKIPVAFQIFEADHLEIGDVRLNGQNSIIHSIEFDPEGRRVKYHLLKTHPGNSLFFNNREKFEIAADKIAHVYKLDRPGQNRGVPVLTPVMLRLRDIDEYQDAQIVRQKVAACFAAFIYDTELADSGSSNGNPLPEKIEPGILEYLPPGKDIKFSSPPSMDGYKEFLSVELHAVAAALGITFESLTTDLGEVNFSSARMGHLQMQRVIDAYRWQVLGPCFLDFVAAKFLQAAELRGYNVSGAEIIWTPPKREMIDPTKEVPATIKAIRGGLTTLGESVRQTGEHLEIHLAQMAEENKLIDKFGLTLDSDGRKTDQKGAQQDQNSEESGGNSPENEENDAEDE